MHFSCYTTLLTRRKCLNASSNTEYCWVSRREALFHFAPPSERLRVSPKLASEFLEHFVETESG